MNAIDPRKHPQYQAYLGEQLARDTAKEDVAKLLGERKAGAASQRLKVLSRAEVRALPPQEYLIDQWLPARSLVYCYGEPSAGKSFLTIDMACCVQEGRQSFHSYDVRPGVSRGLAERPGRRVVYVMSEGLPGLDARLSAWENTHNGGAETSLKTVTGAPQMTSADHVAWLADVAEGADLIVVDTQSRSTTDINNENDNAEMARVVAAYAKLIEDVGCTVLVVHHGDGHLRGATTMRGSADGIIKVENSGGIVTASLRQEAGGKVKDGETPPDLQLVLAKDPGPLVQGVKPSVALVSDVKALSSAELDVLTVICTHVDGKYLTGEALSTTEIGRLVGRSNVHRELDGLHKRFLVSKHRPKPNGPWFYRASDRGEQEFVKAGGTIPAPPVTPLPAEQAAQAVAALIASHPEA